MATIRQTSFAGGEISPELYGRSDLQKYAVALRRCENFIPTPTGALVNRPGTQFVREVKDSTKATRLVPFIYSQTQSYVLEFGDLYIRFHTNGGTVVSGTPVEVVTPYVEADLFDLKFAQSGDVLTITHPSYQPRTLTRSSHTSWALAVISFASTISAPSSISDTVSTTTGDATHVSKEWGWQATSVDKDGQESLPSTAFGVGTAGAIVDVCRYPDRVVEWSFTPATNAVRTNFYCGRNGVYGFIGETTNSEFKDDGQTPLYSETPPRGRIPFPKQTAWAQSTNYVLKDRVTANGNTYECASAGTSHNSGTGPSGTSTGISDGSCTWNYLQSGTAAIEYPSCTCYFQQRRVFAGSAAYPGRVELSRTGEFRNFDPPDPPKSDSSMSVTLAATQREEVRHVYPMGRSLVVHTDAAEWTVSGAAGDPLTPTSIDVTQHSAWGADSVAPVRIGDAALFVVNKGQGVRDLSLNGDTLASADLSVMAGHLVDGLTIVDSAYAAVPYSLAWFVRDDGVLLSLTYHRAHEVWAWARHTTDGLFESVACVPESDEDATYVVVKRTVNGSSVRYVERFATRRVGDVREGVFVDSSLSFDGRNTGATTMTASGASYAAGATVTVTASTSTFVSGDVGDWIVLDPDGTTPIRLQVTAYTSGTVVSAEVLTPVPVAYRATATTNWAWARNSFSGADHLEGETVTVLADGFSVGTKTVASGAFSLTTPAVIIHAGLAVEPEIETLDLAVPNAELRSRVKAVSKVGFEAVAVRGIWVGEDADHLVEAQIRPISGAFSGPPGTTSGLVEAFVKSSWNTGGRAVLRVVDPLPCSLSTFIRTVEVGGA